MAPTIHEHGRVHLRTDPRSGTSLVLIENVNRSDEHWLTLTGLDGNPGEPIGYLRLRPVATDPHTFEIAELRPATGPLLRLPGDSSDPAASAPAGSEAHG